MNKHFKSMVSGLVLILSIASNLWAEETAIEGNAEAEGEGIGLEAVLDFYSRYVWRGFELNDNKPTLQPAITYSAPFGLEFNAWASVGLDKKTNLDEVDLTLTYTYSILPDRLDLYGGGVNLLYLGTQSSELLTATNEFEYSFEVFGGLTLNGLPVTPSLTYYRGLGGSDGPQEGTGGDNKGNYVELLVEYEISFLDETLSFAPNVAAGLQNEYGIDPVFSHVQLNLPLSYSYGKFSVTPSFNLTFIPSPEDINGDDRKILVSGGLGLSCEI